MKKRNLVALACVLSLTIPHNSHAATTQIVAHDQAAVETYIRTAFKDVPAMVEIARCESKFRQFTDSGNVLRSNGMIGVFQFYESIHAPGALALGFDLATLEGNVGYAKHVYKTEGTTPWNGSRYCWEIPAAAAQQTVATTITTPTRDQLLKQIATLTKLITLLQLQIKEKRALKK